MVFCVYETRKGVDFNYKEPNISKAQQLFEYWNAAIRFLRLNLNHMPTFIAPNRNKVIF